MPCKGRDWIQCGKWSSPSLLQKPPFKRSGFYSCSRTTESWIHYFCHLQIRLTVLSFLSPSSPIKQPLKDRTQIAQNRMNKPNNYSAGRKAEASRRVFELNRQTLTYMQGYIQQRPRRQIVWTPPILPIQTRWWNPIPGSLAPHPWPHL